MSAAIPVSVVTGFLGAGKSTLLRRLLDRPVEQRIALIVNEIGPGGTDAPIGVEGTQALELPAGCVCCLRNPELISTLAELASGGQIDRVILETTGLADPLALTWTLERPDVAVHARLDGVLTVVDALAWSATRTPEWEAQIAAADLVALAKTDLATDVQREGAREVVRELNPAARILDAADVPLALLLDGAPAKKGTPTARHSDFGHVSVVGDVYRLEPLEDLLEELPLPVFRAKGIVKLHGGKWAGFHAVGGRLQLDPDVPAPPHGESRMVFFGRGIDEPALRALIAATR